MKEYLNPQSQNRIKTGQRSAQLQAQSSDVEQVLEHISSPFRWEILDVAVEGKNKTRPHGMRKLPLRTYP